MLRQLSTKPPRVSAAALDCPIWLEKLILKLMEKEPLQRPADARAVVRSLHQIYDRMADGTAALSYKGSDAARPAVPAREPETREIARGRRRFRTLPRYQQRWLMSAGLIALSATVAFAIWLGMNRTESRSLGLWIGSLRHSHAAVRAEATRALGDLGPDAGAAVPALVAALDDSDPDVRGGAVRALERIGPAS